MGGCGCVHFSLSVALVLRYGLCACLYTVYFPGFRCVFMCVLCDVAYMSLLFLLFVCVIMDIECVCGLLSSPFCHLCLHMCTGVPRVPREPSREGML